MSLSRILCRLLFIGLLFTCTGFWWNDGAPAAPSAFATADQITHDGLVKTAVLSDGSALYVAEEKEGHQVISKIVPGTGEKSTVTTPFSDVRALDVSPDHKTLLATPARAGAKNRELWTIPLNKHSQLTTHPGLRMASSWSR